MTTLVQDSNEKLSNDLDINNNEIDNKPHSAVIYSMLLGPETYILVYPGHYIPVSVLEGKNVKIWNGIDWSEVNIKLATDLTKLLQISFMDGTIIRCGYSQKCIMLTHELLENLKNRNITDIDIKNATRVNTPHLKPGMTIINGNRSKYALRDTTSEKFKLGYTQGVYSTSGAYKNIKLPNDILKKIYLVYLESERAGCYNRMMFEEYDKYMNIKVSYKKNYVPLTEELDIKSGWLSGLFDSRAIIINNGVIITYNDLNFIYKVKLLADSLGISCVLSSEPDRISINPDISNNMLVDNIKYYNLLFDWYSIKRINKLFKSAVLDLDKLLIDKDITKPSNTIESVKYSEAFTSAYTIYEENTNACLVSGVLLST